jgi:hypothetical protein
MIEFTETENRLELTYQPEFGSGEWVERELENHGEVRIARTFHFSRNDLVRKNDENDDRDEFEGLEETSSFTFALGSLEEGYFKITGEKLGIRHDIYLAADLPISSETFIAHRHISIFRNIDRVTAEDIYIGGDKPGAMPISEFERLLKFFPNSTELDRYANAKVARILNDYFETTSPAEKRFEDYLNKRGRDTKIHDIPGVYKFEELKYEFIRDKITELLKDESSFSENEWRDLMLQFILLIFPKYVCVLRNVLIKDFYSSFKKPKNRYIDIALLDANGNIDIIEIKKPFENSLVSESEYRGSFTPRKMLSATIMQAEKYMFHLNKWGVTGETDITSRQSAHLPAGLSVKITRARTHKSISTSAAQLMSASLR